MGYIDGGYWAKRSDMLYYKAVDYVVRVVGAEATSLVDVGTGNSPYVEWFDWIPEKVSIDIRVPYGSERVQAITANVIDHDFGRRFDVCTCLQVLEHVKDAAPFARRLFEISDIVIISVPYKWPRGRTQGHVHDPVTRAKLRRWTGRRPNASFVVKEPLLGWTPPKHPLLRAVARWIRPIMPDKSRRLVAVYQSDSMKNWYGEALERRRTVRWALRAIRSPRRRAPSPRTELDRLGL